MVIPVPAQMSPYPPGPPPPEMADKLRPLGWCMIVILILSVVRVVLGDSLQGVLGDLIVTLVVLALLRHDTTFGRAGTSLMQTTQGFCGEGGLSCLIPVAFICTIDIFFDGIKAYGCWKVYSSWCLSGDSGQAGSSMLADGGNQEPKYRFLHAKGHHHHHASSNSASSTEAFTTTGPTSMASNGTDPSQSVQEAVSAVCSWKLPALLATLLLRILVAVVMTCFCCRAFQALQALMIRDLEEIDDYGGLGGLGPGRFGGPGGFGGFGGHGYQPDGPAETFHGHGRSLAADDAALQQALAASAAEAQGGATESDDLALQQALEASAADAQGGAGNAAEEDLALQEALRQSREEELARRERAAAAAEARARG